MLLLCGIITVLFTGIMLTIFRDLRVPPVLLGIEFSIIYILEYLIGYEIYSEEFIYIYFFIGIVCFFIGYILFSKMRTINICHINKNEKTFCFNTKILNLILIIGDIYCVFEINRMWKFAQLNYIENLFTTIHRLYTPSLLLGRIRLCIYAISVICAIIYFMFQKDIKNKLIFWHSFVLAIIYALLTTGRAQVLLPLISVLIIWIYSESRLNLKKISALLIGLVVFISFFLYTAILKYPHLSNSGLNDFFAEQIKIYLCSSMPAFVHWTKEPMEYLYGQNTFRFFYAIIGMSDRVVSIAQDFVSVGELKTNVYTFYHYYAKDFGLIYALIVQFSLGGFYSILYKKSKNYYKKSRSFFVYFGLYAFLFYALAMQYGGDSYFALFSTWLQLCFWLWVFSRKWIIKETNYDKN